MDSKHKWLLIIYFWICLSGCIYTTAVTTSAQVVYDRYNLNKKIGDNSVSYAAYRNIYLNSDQFKNTNVSIATFNDSVLITGQIPETQEKQEINQIVRSVAAGRNVYDYTEIASPSSAITQASDSLITAKIKAQLISISEADPTQIKVVTENGTVYLMGVVRPEQADIAVRVAQATDGVQNIVKIFSYLEIVKKA